MVFNHKMPFLFRSMRTVILVQIRYCYVGRYVLQVNGMTGGLMELFRAQSGTLTTPLASSQPGTPLLVGICSDLS